MRGAVVLLAWGAAACGGNPATPAATAEPGQPIPGLGAADLGRFEAGKTLFNTVFTEDRGLGPTFNENQCSACHTFPESGGFGGERVLKASRDDGGACDALEGAGGANIRRKVTNRGREAGVPVESVPEGATPGRFTAPPLFGFGLLDAIRPDLLERLADPDDRDGDGISGRLGADAAGALARFGRKADVATLAEFVASAAHLEMGLTSSAHPEDLAQGQPIDGSIDGVAGPELDGGSLALLTDYVRFLAPTGRGPAPTAWTDAQVAAGEQTFSAIGCAACHVPSLVTGPAEPAALRRREVAFYSDFLLHDMGPVLADLCTPGAGPRELRTEPLMGLRLRELLLHDGRTTDLRRAIELHDGEARAARDAFGGLGASAREALLAFLRTL